MSRPHVVIPSAASALAYSNAVDASIGYPRDAFDFGRGPHAPKVDTRTLRNEDTRAHQALPLWAYPYGLATQAQGVPLPSGAKIGNVGTTWSRAVVVVAGDPSAPMVFFCGNSLTAGAHVATVEETYPWQTMAQLPALWGWQNVGLGGQTTPEMQDEAVGLVDVQWSAARSKQIICAWEVGNDLYSGATASEAYARIVAYCNARRAAGFRVVVLTVTPRRSDRWPGPNWNPDRLTANAQIRANFASFADALADVDGVPALQATSDVSLYPDGTHMSGTGYGLVAAVVAQAIGGLP